MVSADKLAAIRAKAEALSGESLGQTGDLLVEMAAQRAMAFCQRQDIPEEMEQAVAALAVSMAGGEAGLLKSIQRGDTSLAFAVGKAPLAAPESLLRPFCRLGRVRRAEE